MSHALVMSHPADTGCNTAAFQHDNCITCPRPTCVYDDIDATSSASVAAVARNRHAVELLRQGMMPEDVALVAGVSGRTAGRLASKVLHGK